MWVFDPWRPGLPVGRGRCRDGTACAGRPAGRTLSARIGSLLVLLVAQPGFLSAQAPEDDDPLLQAEIAVGKGRDRKALALVEKTLEQEPGDREALDLGVEIALNVGEYG